MLLLTDEPVLWSEWPREHRRPIRSALLASLRGLRFDPGSMGPKVESACEFVARSGKTAAIGALEDAVRIVHR